MINTAELEVAIKKGLGSFFSTDAHSWTSIIRYINSWVKYMIERKKFTFNKYIYRVDTTDENTTEFSIPYQIETFFIQNEAWDEVKMYKFEDYFRLRDKSDSICVHEDRIITKMKWKFDIYYKWYPKTITSISQTLEVPEHFLDVIILIATYYWFLDIKAFDKANSTKSIMDWFLKNMATRSSDKFPLETKRLNESENVVW